MKVSTSPHQHLINTATTNDKPENSATVERERGKAGGQERETQNERNKDRQKASKEIDNHEVREAAREGKARNKMTF